MMKNKKIGEQCKYWKYKGWTFKGIKIYCGKGNFLEIIETILFSLKILSQKI